MSRGVNRDSIFVHDDDRTHFLDLLAAATSRHHVEVHAYCLMTNHFHLLLRCPEAGLSGAVHDLLSVYAQSFNDRHGRTGHLFGGRFTSRWLTSHLYIVNVVRYIHRNPLDIAGVDDPRQHRWSSHRAYLSPTSAPTWLRVDEIGRWLGGPRAFDAFVRRGQTTTPRDSAGHRFDANDLLGAIDVVLAERSQTSGRHVPAQRRALAIAALPHLDFARQTSLCEALRLTPSTNTYRKAQSRAHQLLRAEPHLRHAVDLALDLIDDHASTTRAA